MKTNNTKGADNTYNAARGIRLGEILVERGLLTRDEVRQVLAVQQEQGRPFGVVAERLFGLDPRAVESAWVTQYAALVGTVDPFAIDADDACLRMIDRRQAWQFHLAVVGRENDELLVLTEEKHLARALRFAANTFKEPTFFQLVDGKVLDAFLMEHYPVPAFLAQYATAR